MNALLRASRAICDRANALWLALCPRWSSRRLAMLHRRLRRVEAQQRKGDSLAAQAIEQRERATSRQIDRCLEVARKLALVAEDNGRRGKKTAARVAQLERSVEVLTLTVELMDQLSQESRSRLITTMPSRN